MRDLLIEYKEARKGLRDMLKRLGDNERDNVDKTYINSMINSVTKIIEWLETGRNPYFQQGVDVEYAYDVTKLSNMDLLPDINEQIEREKPELTDEQRQTIIKVFRNLSDRERDCFILYYGAMMSMAEIAKQLGISKGSVQMYLNRAREKSKKLEISQGSVQMYINRVRKKIKEINESMTYECEKNSLRVRDQTLRGQR